MKKPLISIIIVSYNSVSKGYNISKTIKSILNQTYKNYEIILVDGLSQDNTVKVVKEIVKKNKASSRFSWISEKDDGIYDAMNKGVKLALGDLVFFLNSDDYFVDSEVLEDLIKVYSPEIDFYYGSIKTIYKNSNSYIVRSREATIENLKNGFMLPHQGTFVKRLVQINLPFDPKLKLSADFDFFCRLLLSKRKGKKFERIIAVVSSGGASSEDASYTETSKCVRKYFGEFHFYKVLIEHFLFKNLKKLTSFFKLEKIWHKINSKVGI